MKISLNRALMSIKNWAESTTGKLEAFMRRLTLNHSGITVFFIKLFLSVLVLAITLIPLWFGLGLYVFAMFIAGLLGIAVIYTKIAVFILLLIVLGQAQIVMGLLGLSALVLVLLA